MSIEAVQKTYRRYAPRYDFLFGAVFHPGRKAVIDYMDCKPGERILEVGVGTGLSLPLYPEGVKVTGIDISEEMLARAIKLKEQEGLDNVTLATMDAEKMTFGDNRFDKVVAMYVASVVPNPIQLVAEMRRVCRPGGELLFVNHFHSNRPVVKSMEKLLMPLSQKLGFNPGFSEYEFIRDTELKVNRSRSVNMFGYWKLLQILNDKQPVSNAEKETVDAVEVVAV
ncbi:MAG: SAM-dependent methyltransferase [Thiothrix sp.]|nr:MAG: SAM-dependent methyltransferase [Thiothrix sp.]